MRHFDVIIIGAGPAGLACAKHLSMNGKKILLIEKNEKLGIKICGGGLTKASYTKLNIPDKLTKNFHNIIVHTSSQERVIITNDTLVKVIDRDLLAAYQKSQINLENVTIMTGITIKKITKKYIQIKEEKIRYSYLVGADGVNSVVRKFLGLKIDNLIIGMHYLIKTNVFRSFEMFFDPMFFGPGYAWIIPHKNFVSVGVGSETRLIKASKLKSNFDTWLNLKGIDFSNAKFESFPINHDYKGHEFSNIFLIGEAAGFSSRLTGEGISQAIISGEETAKKIINNNYDSKPIKSILKKKKLHNLVVSILSASSYVSVLIFEIFALCLKSRWFTNKLITKGV